MIQLASKKLYFKYLLRTVYAAKFFVKSFAFGLFMLVFTLQTVNTSPIFALTPSVKWGSALITAANTAYDGTGTVTTIFTAGANGSFVSKVRFKLGSTSGSSAATVARVFINNGSANSTPANNILWEEITLPIVAQTQVAATPPFEVILNIALPAGYVINVTLGTASGGSTGWYAMACGGDY